MKCHVCDLQTKQERVPFEVMGKLLGEFDADVCSKCGEIIFTEKASRQIDAAAKMCGLWGIEKKLEHRIAPLKDLRVPTRKNK